MSTSAAPSAPAADQRKHAVRALVLLVGVTVAFFLVCLQAMAAELQKSHAASAPSPAPRSAPLPSSLPARTR